MRNTLLKLKDGMILGIWIILIFGIAHAAVVLTATDWEALTSTKWNGLVDKVSWITSQPDWKVNISELCDETGANCKDLSVSAVAGSVEYFAGYELLEGNITWSGITPTNHYPVTVPNGTKAVKLNVHYEHWATWGTHGYLSFWAYQKWQSSDNKKVRYVSTHYSDYANTDQTRMDIPWDENLDDEITIEVTDSHNTSGLNKYELFHAGHVVQN